MDTYYLLMDKDSGDVSLVWKGCHLLMLSVVTISGFITTYLFGKGSKGFGNQCVLYANVVFKENVTNNTMPDNLLFRTLYEQDLKPIDESLTKWSSLSTCYFCQFMPLVSTISAILWITMFTICSRGGRGFLSDVYSRPWRLIYPALLFSLIATIPSFLSASKLYYGITGFCAEFKEALGDDTCTSAIDNYTIYFNEKRMVRNSIIPLYMSSIFSWTCSIFWLLHTLILIVRIICVADFRLVQVVITAKVRNVEVNSQELFEKRVNDILQKALPVLKRAMKTSPGKIERNSADINNVNTEITKDNKSISNKQINEQRSPSLNYVDDSPYVEENDKDFFLNNMKHVTDQQSNGNAVETAFQAPRADLGSL